jgi:hypothetical protein
MGCAVPQSALLRQSTHWPCASRQRGWLAGQSTLVMHSMHCWVVKSQMGCPAPQSVRLRHPTQTPLPEVVSQMGAFIGQSALAAQDAWQLWSAGQHAGVAAGQSALTRHDPHWPVAATQKGAEAGHPALVMHSTHPSVGLQV